jgi:drug/metabolite transporter (DMT)-like permease
MDTLALQQKLFLLFPLLAGLLYAIGTLGFKAGSALGVDSLRATVSSNVFMAVGFLIFMDWRAFPTLPDPPWVVFLLAALFTSGQVFTIMAVSTGEVSSVTPVLGIKVVFVGLLAVSLLGAPLGAFTWVAAVLSIIGIACLQANDRPEHAKRQGLAVLLALLAAASFAGFDAMTQYWSPIVGFGRLVPPGMILMALCSVGCLFLLPRRPAPAEGKLSGKAWAYLGLGCLFFTLQALVLIRSIGAFGHAAEANVVYSMRGLWTILLVWGIGRWFGNTELHARSRRILWTRTAGAALLCVSTVLVFL